MDEVVAADDDQKKPMSLRAMTCVRRMKGVNTGNVIANHLSLLHLRKEGEEHLAEKERPTTALEQRGETSELIPRRSSEKTTLARTTAGSAPAGANATIKVKNTDEK